MMKDRRSEKPRMLSKRDVFCERVIEFGLLGLIIFSPLPAASTGEWSILTIQLIVLIMFVSFIIMKKKPQDNELLSRSLKWPSYMFIGVFTFIVLQIIPLPKLLVKIFSPNTFSFHELNSVGFLNRKFMSISLIPSHTFREGLEVLSYFLVAFLIVKTVTKKQQIIRIFSALVALGTFQAFYGLFELYNRSPNILFYKKIYHLDSVTGTFVNRNHLSGYLEMIIPLAIGLIISRISFFSFAGLKWREKLLRLSQKGLSINLVLVGSIIIMSLAILFSKSRSGMFILFFTFVLFFGLTKLYFGSYEHHKKGIRNFLNISFLLVIIISLYIGIDATVERFAIDDILVEGRPIFWGNTLRIFSKYPLFGAGLGTFPSIYPDLMIDNKLIRIYHAHNDYLEYLSEMGIVGFILLVGGIFLLIMNAFRLWKRRRHPEVKGLAIGGFVSVFCILFHSITDFNLHIPANMLLFSVVLSLTLVITNYKRRNNLKKPSQQSPEEEDIQLRSKK